MAEVIWTDPAYFDLDEITEYIAFDDPVAADRLARRVLGHVRQLMDHPKSGSIVSELDNPAIRQLVEPPCRIFYRFDGKFVWILRIFRSERLLRASDLER